MGWRVSRRSTDVARAGDTLSASSASGDAAERAPKGDGASSLPSAERAQTETISASALMAVFAAVFGAIAAASSLAAAQTLRPAQPDVEEVIEREETAQPESGGAAALREVLDLDAPDAGGRVVLEADAIEYEPASQLVVAMGDVRVFHNGRTLRADMITYDGKNDKISASGQIRLINEDGSVLTADSAEFDGQIRDGLIVGARAVLADGQARLAAVEARRIDGRFTQLSKAVFSPCEVCADSPTPLWRIRARRVIQDEVARDIIYEDAVFEVMGVPVGFLPFFRHPDPTVERRTGFLVPEFGSSSELGLTAKVPYFIELAPNQDITLTPYVLTEDNPVLEAEYRAAVESGGYSILTTGTQSGDEQNEGFRWHVDGDGRFDTGLYDFDIGFDALIASDDGYLRRYNYTDADRVEVRGYVERFKPDGYISAEAIRYQSFREDEPTGDIPRVAPLAEFEQYAPIDHIGGEFFVAGNTLYLQRTEGRDVSRLSGTVGWTRNLVSRTGFLFETTASVRGDVYRTFDDPEITDDGATARVLPLASLNARYPVGKTTQFSSYIIEPIATLVYAPPGGNPDDIPNEDSRDTELDELSIFQINRFSGIDAWEEGPRATVGMRYNQVVHSGPEFEASLARAYRPREIDTFSESAGLNDTRSDIVGAWRVTTAPFFTVGQRFRVDNDLALQRNEVYTTIEATDRFRLQSSYVFLEADPEAGAEDDREEANVAAALDLTPNWTIAGDVRRDIEEDRFVTAGGALRYANECCEIDLTLDRRFNSVEDAPTSTNFGLVVRLKGLGSQ